MSAFIRKLNDVDGNVVFPATRAEGVYFTDNSVLQDYVASDGVMKKAVGDKNGKDITSYLDGLSVSGKTITFHKGDGTSGTITTQDTTYGEASSSAAGLMSVADKKKLDGIEDGANKYTHPSYTQQASGLYNVTIDNTGHVSAATKVIKDDITALGIPAQDTTYTPFSGSAAGLVPSATPEDAAKYLKADGTWGTPENTTYENATTDTAGLMSAEDKKKLDGVAEGANKYTHPTYTPKESGLYKVTVDETGHVSGTANVTKTDITALGIPGQDTTYSEFSGSAAGLVPAATSGDAGKYLKGDGSWGAPPTITVDAELSSSSTNPVQNKVINSALSGKADVGHTHSDMLTIDSSWGWVVTDIPG